MTHPLHPLTQTSLTTHAYICVHSYAYAWDSHPQTNTPRTQLHRPRICVVESRQTTPMRGRVTPDHFLIAILPRICVPSNAYAWEPYLHK
ncbi:hypothetical protein PIB30_106775, partial [Stylosanthes scabra]|nr:hypothetical protein [Stylosanthes scabra]